MNRLAGMTPFWQRFRDVAERETRVVTLLCPQAGLPAGGYTSVEFYYGDPGCDCRRALVRLFRTVVLSDETYRARLSRHYTMFKQSQRKPQQVGKTEGEE
jgi:hypothetical protein